MKSPEQPKNSDLTTSAELGFLRSADDGHAAGDITTNTEIHLSQYPTPKIGYYQAECCLRDLYKIRTQDDLNEVLERIANNDECGPLMVFETLDEAITHLTTLDQFTPAEISEQVRRLKLE